MTDVRVPTTRRGLLTGASLAGIAVALGGCGSLFKAATSTPRLFTLTSANDIGPGVDTQWQLVIEEPLASRAIDTDFIALMPSATEVKYFDSGAEVTPRRFSSRMKCRVELSCCSNGSVGPRASVE